jgi:hypothetical protein
MIEMDIDRETLDNLGLRRADEESWWPPGVSRPSLLDVLGPAPKAKRTRRPSISQIEKESGRIVTAITIGLDGAITYTLGEKADAPAMLNEWDKEFDTHPIKAHQ